MAQKKDLLTRLSEGEVIIGDGSYVMTMEKRGYVKAGEWTSRCTPEFPSAVEELAKEYARAGADITQTFTFWCHEDSLPEGCEYTCDEINQSACEIAKKVAKDFNTVVIGGITQTGMLADNPNVDKEKVQKDLRKSLEILVKNDVDVVICEYFHNIKELEWAIEVAKETGKIVAATMCIAPNGDEEGVAVQECGVRMAKAGADIVGLNCLFDPTVLLEAMADMKKGLEDKGLHPHLMVQPLGYRVPDGGSYGWVNIREFPFAVEPRQITRWEARQFARKAYEMGIKFIGGCCGFEPYHIRAMAEELREERGRLPLASKFSDYDLSMYKGLERLERYKNKGSMDFWMKMEPATGRPLSAPCCPQSEPTTMYKPLLAEK